MITIKSDQLADLIATAAQQAQVTSTGLQAGLIAQLNNYPLSVRTAVLALASAITSGVHSA